ncbi:MAG: L-serine ammonia-lyase, iron-sulfur-dependent, subunit alpha [Spirochaetia bacterium]|jgi:L-cysteine desulfidase|nr:L-serine ammonia-lyase, iron-sulfur-dependent, subunit alpha [Spirochaetia bacterium]
MLSPEVYHAYCAILHEELVPAMGCTEPIAVAYAAAYARDVLGMRPERIELRVSANIVKNVKGVTVPNTGGMRGLEAAAIAGVVGGDAARKLEVLQSLDPGQLEEVRRLVQEGMCKVSLAEGIVGLYIEVWAFAPPEEKAASATETAGVPVQASAHVVVEHTHTGIALVEKDGRLVFDRNNAKAADTSGQSTMKLRRDECAGCDAAPRESSMAFVSADRHEYALLNVRDILEFADTLRLRDIEAPLRAQIELNQAIAQEGLKGDWGVSVGKTLMKYRDASDVRVRARALAAAGSDARMAGCPMPVVINSGSGNQGLTVSLPVIEFARTLKVGEEKLLRALAVSNLVALEQKEYVGKLSAYCGAVSAAVGAAAGIAYLQGASYEQLSAVVIDSIATADGILCDGAKSSCAAKIATALESAMLALELGMHEGRRFRDDEGLAGADVEETIRNVGIVAKNGMRATDAEIIRVMLER